MYVTVCDKWYSYTSVSTTCGYYYENVVSHVKLYLRKPHVVLYPKYARVHIYVCTCIDCVAMHGISMHVPIYMALPYT